METLKKPKIIIIGGPTGIGKTATAIRLARTFGGEIISADSMQVYREMDIGTAKPTVQEQAQVPHHLIDIVNPDEPFDAARFERYAGRAIHDLLQRSRLPLIVGGTGLYIKALLYGLSRARPADPRVLERLNREADRSGPETLHRRLRKCDPAAAQKIHPNDRFRITRALEMYEVTGKPISEIHDAHGFSQPKYQALKICLSDEREAIYHRINRRVDIMLRQGLLREVEQLLQKGYHAGLKSMQSLGYRHMLDFLSREMTWEEAVETMKRDTRRYAKRQLTWFRSDPEICWYAKNQVDDIEKKIQRFIDQDF